MDSAISQLKICGVSTSKLGFSSSPPLLPIVSLPIQQNYQMKKRSSIKCAKESAAWIDKEVDELIRMKKWSETCKQGVGIEELMECLEREAIMGEDQGREAMDYNTRALIFDKSARVFQALKQQQQQTSSS